MARLLTDDEIGVLLREPKRLPTNWRARLQVREKSDVRFRQRDLRIEGDNGNTFRIIIRQNALNLLDFSLILTFEDEKDGTYRLIRFNGRHPSDHTNTWEKRRGLAKSTFRNRFHIHHATERYQIEGLEIDGYAEPTDNFESFDSALELFVRSHGFVLPGGDEPTLFTQGDTDGDD